MPKTNKVERPEHSKLGGSGAERWINCSGSVALIDKLRATGGLAIENEEFREEGKLAHTMGERCLNGGFEAWEMVAELPGTTMEMATAVQVYLDYCNSHPGTRSYTEHQVEHPAFHPLMYGQLDRVIFEPEPHVALEIIDYKHGVGVAVDVEDNAQERYYGFAYINGETWPADLPRLEDMARVKLTIVQPRGFHPDGPVRSVIVTAGELRNWAYNTLLPAMTKAGGGVMDFKTGNWCQFCPAQKALVCPEQRKLLTDAALAATEIEKPTFDLATVDAEWLGYWFGKLAQLDMFKKSVRDETNRRVQLGQEISTAKLVYGKVDRVWKKAAIEPVPDPDMPDLPPLPSPIEQFFGADAWEPPSLRSPAGIEKLPGGKDFCAEYAEKPRAPLTVAPLSDKRAAQKPVTNEEVFANVEIP